MFIDTHCHLFNEYYSDIENVLNNAIKNNVTKFITCGCELKTNEETIALVNKYPNVYGAIGIHPTEISDISKNIDLIEENINNAKIVAIGEIGLDFHYENTDKEEQIKIFKLMLDLAQKYSKPVVIHSRDAFSETYDILKHYKLKGVIHSFFGTLEEAKKYVDLGYSLGINGIVTFKNSNLIEIVKCVSLDKILLETDSPYLSPFRGESNEPQNIPVIAEFIAIKLNIDLPFFAEKTSDNAHRIFDI